MVCVFMKQKKIYENQALLAAQTHFSLEDVKSLTELFRKLSCSICNDGFISKMFNLFDSNNDGQIGFGEFIRTQSIFHPDASQAEKIAVAFKLYDIWQIGFIGREEVKELIFGVLYESELLSIRDITAAFTSFVVNTEKNDEIYKDF